MDPPTNPGTFTGTATVTFTALIVGTQTITTPIEGGWWAPDHDHTAFVIDWTKSESPFAAFYPYTKRARYNGFASMIKTNPGDPTGSMWSGVMLDLNNKVSQTTWVTDGPFQEG